MSTDVEAFDLTTNGGPVTVLPPHPFQANGHRPSAVSTADLGAIAAAMGMERGEVTGLVVELQALAAATGLGAATTVLEKAGRVVRRRLQRLETAVRALPDAPIPLQTTGWRAVLGTTPVPPPGYVAPSYVSREAVLQLIQALAAEDPKAS